MQTRRLRLGLSGGLSGGHRCAACSAAAACTPLVSSLNVLLPACLLCAILLTTQRQAWLRVCAAASLRQSREFLACAAPTSGATCRSPNTSGPCWPSLGPPRAAPNPNRAARVDICLPGTAGCHAWACCLYRAPCTRLGGCCAALPPPPPAPRRRCRSIGAEMLLNARRDAVQA